jgi:NAD(P)H dehydrogenase (quinone)
MQNIADTLRKVTNTTVNYTSPDPKDYEAVLTQAGVPKEYIGMFVGFAEAIKQGEFQAESSDLEKLLGRKPITLETFLKQVYSK